MSNNVDEPQVRRIFTIFLMNSRNRHFSFASDATTPPPLNLHMFT